MEQNHIGLCKLLCWFSAKVGPTIYMNPWLSLLASSWRCLSLDYLALLLKAELQAKAGKPDKRLCPLSAEICTTSPDRTASLVTRNFPTAPKQWSLVTFRPQACDWQWPLMSSPLCSLCFLPLWACTLSAHDCYLSQSYLRCIGNYRRLMIGLMQVLTLVSSKNVFNHFCE